MRIISKSVNTIFIMRITPALRKVLKRTAGKIVANYNSLTLF